MSAVTRILVVRAEYVGQFEVRQQREPDRSTTTIITALLGNADGFGGGKWTVRFAVAVHATPSCLRLFWHCNPRAASRACTAGSNSKIRMPMIVMTVKSSTKVNARGARDGEWRTGETPVDSG